MVAKRSRAGLFAKRMTDVVLATIGLVALSPWLVVFAICICIDSPGPALFTQLRVGKNGKLFKIYKFRTMHVGAPNVATELMAKMDVKPITRFGEFLRKTSIDELPQLFNILKGDMSLVGPRPALYNQYDLTKERQRAGVLTMPPGITGWAQVNGRDDLTDDAKVQMDAWYCARWHYSLDWQIIGKTIVEVIRRRGAF